MILIVGGEGAGKRAFAQTLGFSEEDVFVHAEKLVKTQQDVPAALETLCGKAVVILNEVGAGVIPAERELTLAREAAGRLGVLLAKEASCVVRVVCGIPIVLKGSL